MVVKNADIVFSSIFPRAAFPTAALNPEAGQFRSRCIPRVLAVFHDGVAFRLFAILMVERLTVVVRLKLLIIPSRFLRHRLHNIANLPCQTAICILIFEWGGWQFDTRLALETFEAGGLLGVESFLLFFLPEGHSGGVLFATDFIT